MPACARLKTALAALESVGNWNLSPIGKVDPDRIASDILVAQIGNFSEFPGLP